MGVGWSGGAVLVFVHVATSPGTPHFPALNTLMGSHCSVMHPTPDVQGGALEHRSSSQSVLSCMRPPECPFPAPLRSALGHLTVCINFHLVGKIGAL